MLFSLLIFSLSPLFFSFLFYFPLALFIQELLIEKSGREGQEERANELANQVQELRCALEEKEQIAVSMAKLSAELKNKIRQLEEKQKKSIEIDRAFSQFSSRKNAESKMKAISTMMW